MARSRLESFQRLISLYVAKLIVRSRMVAVTGRKEENRKNDYSEHMDILKLNDTQWLQPLEPEKYEAPACITCSDEGVELEIVQLAVDEDTSAALGKAKDGGTEVIDISLVEPLQLGDRVIAHARMAITKLD